MSTGPLIYVLKWPSRKLKLDCSAASLDNKYLSISNGPCSYRLSRKLSRSVPIKTKNSNYWCCYQTIKKNIWKRKRKINLITCNQQVTLFWTEGSLGLFTRTLPWSVQTYFTPNLSLAMFKMSLQCFVKASVMYTLVRANFAFSLKTLRTISALKLHHYGSYFTGTISADHILPESKYACNMPICYITNT